jgi:tungstate transport system permease protein
MDREVWLIVGRTVLISGAATVLAVLTGAPLGYLMARSRFKGRTLILAIINTGMGLPPVVVGLAVWLMLARSGPLGDFDLIYTKHAMIAAQFIIALPLVVGVSAAAVQALPRELQDLLVSLGAGRWRTMFLIAQEARLGLLAALMAGFGAVISEVGAAMTVGGNLQGSTRVLATAIVTNTGRGEIATALVLGGLLLLIAFATNLVLTIVQQRSEN